MISLSENWRVMTVDVGEGESGGDCGTRAGEYAASIGGICRAVGVDVRETRGARETRRDATRREGGRWVTDDARCLDFRVKYVQRSGT